MPLDPSAAPIATTPPMRPAVSPLPSAARAEDGNGVVQVAAAAVNTTDFSTLLFDTLKALPPDASETMGMSGGTDMSPDALPPPVPFAADDVGAIPLALLAEIVSDAAGEPLPMRTAVNGHGMAKTKKSVTTMVERDPPSSSGRAASGPQSTIPSLLEVPVPVVAVPALPTPLGDCKAQPASTAMPPANGGLVEADDAVPHARGLQLPRGPVHADAEPLPSEVGSNHSPQPGITPADWSASASVPLIDTPMALTPLPSVAVSDAGRAALTGRTPLSSAIEERPALTYQLPAHPGAPAQLTLKLTPAELGAVTFEIRSVAEGVRQVHVLIDRPETLALFHQDHQHLANALARAGLDVEATQVTVSLARDYPAASPPATAQSSLGDAGSGDFPAGGNGRGDRPGTPDRSLRFDEQTSVPPADPPSAGSRAAHAVLDILA